jgi:hypothetical protein
MNKENIRAAGRNLGKIENYFPDGISCGRAVAFHADMELEPGFGTKDHYVEKERFADFGTNRNYFDGGLRHTFFWDCYDVSLRWKLEVSLLPSGWLINKRNPGSLSRTKLLSGAFALQPFNGSTL